MRDVVEKRRIFKDPRYSYFICMHKVRCIEITVKLEEKMSVYRKIT